MLTEKEIADYARDTVAEMSDEDKQSFLDDPESWRDGLHVIACRDGRDVYIDSRDEWDAVRDAMLTVIRG